jgi:ketosteroid isomerase-like protein
LELAFAHRIAEAMAMLHPEASWWVLGDPARMRVSGRRDRAGIERLLNAAARSIPGGMRIMVHGVTAEGERVAVEVESEGVWRDGRRYHNQYHFLLTMRDGLIFAVREYMDTLHVFDISQG